MPGTVSEAPEGGLAAAGLGDKPPDSMWIFSVGVKFSLWTRRKGSGFLTLPLALDQILKIAGRRRLYFFFSLWGHIPNTKFTVLTVFKHMIPWHRGHSYCCAAIFTVHPQELFILQNRNSAHTPRGSLFPSPWKPPFYFLFP